MLSCLSLCFCILLVKGCWLRVGAVAEYMWGYGNEMAEGKLKPGGLGKVWGGGGGGLVYLLHG